MRWWLLAILCAGCVSGNIRSGDDRRPPRIPFNLVDPKPGLVVITDPATQLPMAFRVLQFEEPNLTDTLTVRWFVDYHRNPAIQQQAVRPPELSSPNPTLRSESSFVLTQSMLEPNLATEPHLVEVVVTDRPFDDNPQVLELNRTFAAGAEGDILSWTVQVRTAPSSKPAPAVARDVDLGDLRVAPPSLALPQAPVEVPLPGLRLRWNSEEATLAR